MPPRAHPSSRRSGAGAITIASSLTPPPPPPPARDDDEEKPTSDGLAFGFGWNGHGQLGLGDENERRAPRLIRVLSGVRVRQVFAGSCHSVVVDEDGIAYGFGGNSHGQLGTGDCRVRTTPERFDCDGQRVVNVACGARHTVLCTSRGRVLACGCNEQGQLGLGKADEDGGGSKLMLRPQVVGALSGTRIVGVAAGFAHTLFLSRPGLILASGLGESGQLGLAADAFRERESSDCVFQPASVGELASVACLAVAAGNYHSAALARDDGGVYTWGEGRYGSSLPQLGSTASDCF